MSKQVGPPIPVGYAWQLTIRSVGGDMFPLGSALRAQFRQKRGSPVLADISTSNGGIERVGATEVIVKLTPVQSAAMAAGFVNMDMARTDLTDWVHLGFNLIIPVFTPITVPA